jgi:hypothetical protein
MSRPNIVLAALGLGAVLLGACTESTQIGSSDPRAIAAGQSQRERIRAKYGTIHAADGFTLLGNDQKAPDDGSAGGIGVNSFLWHASLDTIDFMPLVSADPFGGVIITDWYTPPETPDERLKLTVLIRDRTLRADGVKVSVFRQTRDGGSGGWVDAPVDPKTATSLEDKILTRAREIRIANLDS